MTRQETTGLILLSIVALVGIVFLIYRYNTNPEPVNTPQANTNTDTPENNSQVGRCYIGGCSGQICSDEEGVMSTCEYRDEYACYKSAVCERQSDGECGWTQTSALSICLSSAVLEK